jgi:hypothetical protein
MRAKALFLPILLLLLIFVPLANATATADKTPAGSSGSISGTVKDAAGAVLAGAQVVLQPTATTVVSDAQGRYLITNLNPGSYTVTISYVGFTTTTSTVTVTAGQVTPQDVVLNVASANQRVEVTANLEGDAAAINEQRVSDNILNVQTDTQIQSLPNANIADALGRMPGVTLQRNEGEGQYVQIRGTEPRLSNTTIDGVIVPGPDPAVRQVDLDTIPADLVGAVVINKTLSASQDGDAIGGSVDLRIKQATSDRPTLMIEGIDGYTPIDNGRKAFQIDSSAGFRFGPNSGQGKKFGLMLGYSYDYNGRGIDDVEPVPDYDGPNDSFTYDNIYIQQYLYDGRQPNFHPLLPPVSDCRFALAFRRRRGKSRSGVQGKETRRCRRRLRLRTRPEQVPATIHLRCGGEFDPGSEQLLSRYDRSDVRPGHPVEPAGKRISRRELSSRRPFLYP